MIKLFIDFIQFLYAAAPLLSALSIFILLAIRLSKSIKKHATVYYTVFAIPCLLVVIPSILRMLGVDVYNFNRIPFLGTILRDYIHMGTLGFPLLIIIMYIGALNPKNPKVKKLLSIRKELSILSGFPVLTHAYIRVINNFPNALKFFIDKEGYLTNTTVTNELGAGITNFSMVLGILMLVIFIPLWVTSFTSIHKRMGNIRWKKVQKWSYVLYAMLFIHSMGLQIGYSMNPRGGRDASKPKIERTTEAGNNPKSRQAADKQSKSSEAKQENKGKHAQSIGFSDIQVSSKAKQYIHITSLLLIFGSYLYLRLRKARIDSKKKDLRNQS